MKMNQKAIKIKLDTTDKKIRFVEVVSKFISDVDIMTDRACIDGKSVIGLFGLDVSKDVYTRILSDNITENRKFDAAMEEFR